MDVLLTYPSLWLPWPVLPYPSWAPSLCCLDSTTSHWISLPYEYPSHPVRALIPIPRPLPSPTSPLLGSWHPLLSHLIVWTPSLTCSGSNTWYKTTCAHYSPSLCVGSETHAGCTMFGCLPWTLTTHALLYQYPPHTTWPLSTWWCFDWITQQGKGSTFLEFILINISCFHSINYALNISD